MQVAERFAQRIRKGDYHLRELPSERELAAEVGVSYLTARKAVQALVNQGLLRRQANGRAAVHSVAAAGQPAAPAQIALLTPAWESPTIAGWRWALAKVCARLHVSSRTVLYAHWDDPGIAGTMQSFDGTFLIPEPEAPPPEMIEALRGSRRPVVILGHDYSRFGLRSVVLDPPRFLHRLLDHLAALGHRRIDYFNVQPGVSEHLVQWRLWLAAQGLDGEAIDEPVQPYDDPLPAAYAAIDRRLRAGRFRSKALYCTTEPAATGAMAALLDHGLQPGRDVAVCTSEGTPNTAFCNPSLTAQAEIDRQPYLSICMDWILGRSQAGWPGPLLLQAADCEVIVRQSTVPGSKTSRRLAPASGEPKEKTR